MSSDTTDCNVVVEVGGEPDEFSVCLAIYGAELIPSEITKTVGVVPTRSHLKGDRQGPRSKPFKEGAWFYEIRGETPESVADLIFQLLNDLPKLGEIWSGLSKSCRIQMRVAYHSDGWNRDLVIPAKLAGAIASIGADIVLDVYVYEA